MLPRRRDGEAVEVVGAALGAAQRAALGAARAAGPAAHRAPLHAPVALARSVLSQAHPRSPRDLHCAVCCPPLAPPDREPARLRPARLLFLYFKLASSRRKPETAALFLQALFWDARGRRPGALAYFSRTLFCYISRNDLTASRSPVERQSEAVPTSSGEVGLFMQYVNRKWRADRHRRRVSSRVSAKVAARINAFKLVYFYGAKSFPYKGKNK